MGVLHLAWSVVLTTLSIMGALQLTSAQEYTPLCDPSNYTDSSSMPLPDFPPQFSFTIEAALGSFNRTIIVKEYFDDVGNRGRVEFRDRNGTDVVSILDYNLREVFLIPDFRTGDECRVLDPSESILANRSFGFEDRNGTLHIGSPVRFIESIRNESAVRFHGEDIVRGIPVLHWQACTSLENNSYIVDYFFAPRSYDYNGESMNFIDDDDLVPIQFLLRASLVNDSRVINFNHTYTFVNFQSGPNSVPDEVFTIPTGLACKGRIPGSPVPEIPDFFSLYVEFVGDFTQQRVDTIREAYDLNHKLLRIDAYYDGRQGGPPGTGTIIHDFTTGVEYAMNQNNLGCYIQPLTANPFSRFDIDFDEDQEAAPRLVSPNEFFLRGNQFNYSYEGVTTIRGIEVDSWVSVRDFEQFRDGNGTNILYEIFFTRPGWTVNSDISRTTDPVPVRLRISGTFTFMNRTDNTTTTQDHTFQLEMFDFSTSEPAYDVFDVSFCFGPDDYHFLLLAIPGHKEGLDYPRLKRDVRSAIVNLTGLRPLQIGRVEVRGDNSTHIFVATHLYNLTRHATVDPSTNVTADTALQLLINSTNNTTKLPFTLTLQPNVTVSPFLIHFGRGRNASCNGTIPPTVKNNTCTQNCTENITTQLGLTDGVVAGIAIALFFGGMIVGIIGLFICLCMIRCYRSGGGGSSGGVSLNNPVKYKRHDDDIDVD